MCPSLGHLVTIVKNSKFFQVAKSLTMITAKTVMVKKSVKLFQHFKLDIFIEASDVNLARTFHLTPGVYLSNKPTNMVQMVNPYLSRKLI